MGWISSEVVESLLITEWWYLGLNRKNGHHNRRCGFDWSETALNWRRAKQPKSWSGTTTSSHPMGFSIKSINHPISSGGIPWRAGKPQPRLPLAGAMRLSDGKAVGKASAAGLGPRTWLREPRWLDLELMLIKNDENSGSSYRWTIMNNKDLTNDFWLLMRKPTDIHCFFAWNVTNKD